jgi:hypothetical protein
MEGETEILTENLSKCHFIHHEFHMTHRMLAFIDSDGGEV